MNREEREARAREIAAFRYSLIAELANPYLKREELRRLVRQKAGREHEVPFLGKRTLTESCLRKWLAAYKTGGMEGLMPVPRRDSGTCRALSPEEGAVLLSELEAHPEWNATAALRKLQSTGRIQSHPSSSSLSRFVRAAGLDREGRVRVHQQEQTLPFEFFAPLECVQVDCMYTVEVSDAKGRRRQAVLLAFLDDATRRVLYAGFAFNENALAFECGIKHILAAHGKIGRLYADNGSAFVSLQTRRILDILGIVLVHSRPYTPQGRGKIERFFRTVRQQFLSVLDRDSLAGLQDLDTRFHTWLESEYHRSPHRGLGGRPPLEVWLEKAHLIIPVDPSVNLDELFKHEDIRKVHKDSTFTLHGVLYEVDSTLIGQHVRLRYDASIPPMRRRITVYLDGKPCGDARIVDTYANSRVRRAFNSDHLIVDKPPTESPRQPTTPVSASLAASRVLDAPAKKEQP
jgi:transposase InsO family protein